MDTEHSKPPATGPRWGTGFFVVLDGVDGCGKSTQALLLIKTLRDRGFDVLHVREPGGTVFGEAIRSVLLNSGAPRGATAEILAFFSARAELLERVVGPALDAKSVVVCERFVSSTHAYQSAGSGGAVSLVAALEKLVIARTPDLTVILDLPATESRARMQREGDDIERRGIAYFERVRNGFLEYAKSHSNARVVDAGGTPEEVAGLILQILGIS